MSARRPAALTARSYLYVPGDRPDRLDGALRKAGDAVIADLEDAVRPERKDAARAEVVAWLQRRSADDRGPERWVRLNSGERGIADLEAVLQAGLDGVLVPKAEPAAVRAVAGRLAAAGHRARVCALVESARGVMALAEIAAVAGVSHLAIGEADLAADLGLDPSADDRELAPLRLQVVVASAAAGLDAPTGPVHTAVRDLDGLRASTEGLRRLGFGARSAIHPDQVAVIEEVLTPTAEQVERARALIARHDGAGGGIEDGVFVDEAVLRSARRVVARAERAATHPAG